jgi:hypothetical protein
MPSLPPPPLLFLPEFLLNVHSKAVAPLHCRGIAEPKLLQQSVCFVHASAAYRSCLLLASTADAPSLSMTFPPGYIFEAKFPPNCRRLDVGNGSGHFIHDGSLRRANTLLILDKFVSDPPRQHSLHQRRVHGHHHHCS